jgi:hypothetical protein
VVRLLAVLLVSGCSLIVGDIDARDKNGLDGSVGGCSDIQTDPHNCGACGRDCTTLPGVNPLAVACTAGQCDLRGACFPGRADCFGGYIDGCESDLSTPEHCGSCTTLCAGESPLCGRTSAGAYTCATSCTFDTTQCGNTCTNVLTDAQHCGSCTHACPAGNNQTAVCQNGICSTGCSPGFHTCNGICVNSTSTATCGTSCTPCTAPAHGTPVCDNFAGCAVKCDAGFTFQLGSCVPNMSMQDMATPKGDLSSLPLCDCRGLVDPLGSNNQCPITSQCIGNNCCVEDQLNCTMGACPPGACVDPTPCQASVTPQ